MGIADMPNLNTLVLTDNKLRGLWGLQNLPKLEKLKLKKNPLFELVDLGDFPSLKKLVISETLVKNVNDFKSLLHLTRLEDINVTDAALNEETPNAKKELLIIFGKLSKLGSDGREDQQGGGDA
jgi:Leucine-rich repeat (LRR) protein